MSISLFRSVFFLDEFSDFLTFPLWSICWHLQNKRHKDLYLHQPRFLNHNWKARNGIGVKLKDFWENKRMLYSSNLASTFKAVECSFSHLSLTQQWPNPNQKQRRTKPSNHTAQTEKPWSHVFECWRFRKAKSNRNGSKRKEIQMRGLWVFN